MDPYQIILEPIVTEKAFTVRSERKYVFKVNPRATKVDIRSAVAKIFKVKVADVNTSILKPKPRNLGNRKGKTSGLKKAYVTLAPGQKIEELEVQ